MPAFDLVIIWWPVDWDKGSVWAGEWCVEGLNDSVGKEGEESWFMCICEASGILVDDVAKGTYRWTKEGTEEEEKEEKDDSEKETGDWHLSRDEKSKPET